MMRLSLIVAVAALQLVVAATSNPVPSLHGKVSCPECKEIVSIVYGISSNKIALNTTVSVLIDICKAKFVNDTSKRETCIVIMKLGEDVLPMLFNGLNQLAWDIPLTFCADIVKACHEPCCSAGAPPQEVFINFADSKDLSQMRVTWITLNETEGAGVEYWTESGFEHAAKETTRTYTAGGWLGVIHSAVMTGLAPDTKYTYRVGSSVYGWSANFTFRTLPTEIGVPSRPLRIIQIADMGYSNYSSPTTDRMAQLVSEGKVDFIIHNGDVSYADADMQHWDLFMNKVQPFTATVPYMTTPGNHELYWNFTAYQARLGRSMPTPVPAAGSGAMYYTLTIGTLEFIFMDSETWIDTGDLDPAQMQWFHDYMGTVDRTIHPLVTVTHHRPLYCQSCHDILSKILRAQGEKAFYDQKIDLHLSGHYHNYQRMLPVYNDTLMGTNYTNPKAPVYILNGAAGNREGQDGWSQTKPYFINGSSAYGLSYITYAVDQVARIATIKYEFINSVTGNVDDSFELKKNF